MNYGIAFTNGPIILSWKKDSSNNDQVWDSYSDALEANDLGGWTGYVCEYPSGLIPQNQKG